MCDKKFITKYSCARHKRTHTNYVCECGYVVERWSELLAHKKKCTKSGKHVIIQPVREKLM